MHYVLVNVFSVGREPIRQAALNGRLARCCCSRDTAGLLSVLGNCTLAEQLSTHRAATVPFSPDLEYSWANHSTPLSYCANFCENRYWLALKKTFGYLQLDASGNMLLLCIRLFTVIQMSFASKMIFLTIVFSTRWCTLRIILSMFSSSVWKSFAC